MSGTTLNHASNEAELKDFFRELDKEIDSAIKSHEVELSSLFASLGTEDLQKKGTAWVLYLSGDGSKPTTRSDGKAGNCCLMVPYRESDGKSPSVENWIQQCWRECEAERVRWFLKDLLEYIRQSFELENTPSTEEE